MFDNPDDWEIAEEMGVANYGQMTAGGWMYIGPQGIVHGTFNTLLNAGRLKLGFHRMVTSGISVCILGPGWNEGRSPSLLKLPGVWA